MTTSEELFDSAMQAEGIDPLTGADAATEAQRDREERRVRWDAMTPYARRKQRARMKALRKRFDK
jgi:hypothetical protein